MLQPELDRAVNTPVAKDNSLEKASKAAGRPIRKTRQKNAKKGQKITIDKQYSLGYTDTRWCDFRPAGYRSSLLKTYTFTLNREANIMKMKLGLCILVLVLSLTAISAAERDPNFHIYLCFGQSNMEGYPGIADQDKTGVDERFRVLAAVDNPAMGRTKGNWYTATPPLCRGNSGISPADYFGRTLVAKLPENIKVGVVNVSVAGCKIELFEKDTFQSYASTAAPWMKTIITTYGGNPYQYLVDMARTAQKDGVIKGILLHQGESNTGDRQWPAKVKGVYDNLLKDLGLKAEDVPLLAGELVPADQGGACASMNPIIAALPETIPTAHAVSSTGCQAQPDRLHFNPAGYRELGKRYGEKMLTLLGYGDQGQPDAAQKAIIPDASWACGMPGGIPVPEKGVAVLEAKMNLRDSYDVGKTQYGRRMAFVVAGGTVSGEKIQGQVSPGALDLQLTLSNGVVEIEQVMVFRTNDGSYIFMRNAGTGTSQSDVRVVMDFEAPNASPFNWLNSGSYVARRTLDLEAKTLTLTVYEVSEAAAGIDVADAVKMAKPKDTPAQPWDYRRTDASERQGPQLIVENVALGASTSVGASKRGNRNIIPITGGTLSGKIAGKVLFGGADYQNFSAAPTIDARYLWQTDDGEVIVVRNTGSFGGLVPTFEAKIDGKYAWLNDGKYLSSNPGMGAGGVSLTFYESSQTN